MEKIKSLAYREGWNDAKDGCPRDIKFEKEFYTPEGRRRFRQGRKDYFKSIKRNITKPKQ